MNEKIKKELDRNNAVCDLSEIDLNKENTEYIIEKLKKNVNIGLVKLKYKSSVELVKTIEEQVLVNIENYRTYPTDHVHCLLSSHCLETLFDKNYSEHKFKEEKYKILNEQKWKVQEVFELKGYKSVLYINDRTRHMVLAFRGIKLEVSDFFIDESQISSVVNSMLANLDIASQTKFSYLHTKTATDLCKTMSEYSLSFTGYGFGAWLAEQAAFFASEDFDFKNTKSVTFECPGSLDYLEKLKETNLIGGFDFKYLNIVTYLSAPNFLNTCNRHAGQVYRVFTNSDNLFKPKEFVEGLIQKIPDKYRKPIRKCYEKTMQNKVERYSFYINSFTAMLEDGLDLILCEFDPKSGKPKQFMSVEKWPHAIFKPSDNFQNNFNDIFKIENISDNIPFVNGLVPSCVKSLFNKVVDIFTKPIVSAITSNLLSGISIIINLIIEIKNGNLNNNECLNYFEYDDNKYEFNRDEKEILKSNHFELSYLAKYKLNYVDLKIDVLRFSNRGSIDHYLFNLKKYSLGKSDFKSLKNNFIEEQLNKLKSMYTLDRDGTNELIKSREEIEIELIRFQLAKLLMLHNGLNDVLNDLDIPKSSNPIQLMSSIERSLNPNFSAREKEVDMIKAFLLEKQYVYIYGLSGCGKSEIARKIATDYKENPGYVVKWIQASFLKFVFIGLAENLQVSLVDNPNTAEMFTRIKLKLNAHIKQEELKVLFIIDDLNEESFDDFKYLTVDLNLNILFLITTKNPHINDNLTDDKKAKLELSLLKEEAFFEYIQIALKKENQTRFERKDWERILAKVSSSNKEILPIDLEKLLLAINDPSKVLYDIDDMLMHIENYMNTPYLDMKKNKPNIFKLLSYFAYLDGNYISLELIKCLISSKYLVKKEMKLEEKDKLGANLSYLQNISEIKSIELSEKKRMHSKRITYQIHELTQLKILKEYRKQPTKENKIVMKIVDTLNSLIREEHIDSNALNMDEELNEYFNHSLRILKLENKSKGCDILTYKIGMIYEKKFLKFNDALKYYNESLEITKKNSSSAENLDVARILNRIGLILNEQGKFNEALKYYQSSLDIRRKVYGTDEHQDVAESLDNIGLVFISQGKDDALPYFQSSLDIRKKVYGTDEHQDVAISLNRIGLYLFSRGHNDEALEYFNHSLDIKKKIFRTEVHPEVALTLNNIGMVLTERNEYKEALEYYELALKIDRQIYETDYHPSVATTISNIGVVFEAQDQYDEAIANFKLALEIDRKIYETDEHPFVALLLNNIGKTLAHQGNYDQSREYFNESLRIKRILKRK